MVIKNISLLLDKPIIGQAFECSSIRLSSPFLTKTKRNRVTRLLYVDKTFFKGLTVY